MLVAATIVPRAVIIDPATGFGIVPAGATVSPVIGLITEPSDCTIEPAPIFVRMFVDICPSVVVGGSDDADIIVPLAVVIEPAIGFLIVPAGARVSPVIASTIEPFD